MWDSISRFFLFRWIRAALSIGRKADQQFTGSVSGIRDAYQIEIDRQAAEYRSLEAAVGEVEMVLEDKRQRLHAFNEKEKVLIQQRDGALTLAERDAADPEASAKHRAAFERFDKEILDIEEKQAALEAAIAESDKNMASHLRRLTQLQADFQKLPEERAEAIASFISDSKLIELNQRMAGLSASKESGPIAAVREANRKLSAQAKVSQKLAGTDSLAQDAEYRTVGRSSTSSDRMAQMLAARATEKAAKTGAAPAAPEKDKVSPGSGNRPSL